MFPGVLALVGRSLRVDARSWPPHLARFGLMAAIYIALCSAIWNARWFGAPGLRFFHGIAYLNVSFMTLLGVSFFSTSITEEKEEDTLGLILMAGISPLGILIGKSGGRLFQALLLMAVQYPFTQLAVTMGGVSQAQVSAAFLGLSAYMILLAGFGALCSTISSNNRGASMWMILGLLTYSFVSLIAANFLAHLARSGIGASQIQSNPWLTLLDHISRFSVFNQLETILTTGFGETLWSWQVVSNSVTGIGCFGLAWALFGVCSFNPAAEASTRGLVARGARTFPLVFAGSSLGQSVHLEGFSFRIRWNRHDPRPASVLCRIVGRGDSSEQLESWRSRRLEPDDFVLSAPTVAGRRHRRQSRTGAIHSGRNSRADLGNLADAAQVNGRYDLREICRRAIGLDSRSADRMPGGHADIRRPPKLS